MAWLQARSAPVRPHGRSSTPTASSQDRPVVVGKVRWIEELALRLSNDAVDGTWADLRTARQRGSDALQERVAGVDIKRPGGRYHGIEFGIGKTERSVDCRHGRQSPYVRGWLCRRQIVSFNQKAPRSSHAARRSYFQIQNERKHARRVLFVGRACTH